MCMLHVCVVKVSSSSSGIVVVVVIQGSVLRATGHISAEELGHKEPKAQLYVYV